MRSHNPRGTCYSRNEEPDARVPNFIFFPLGTIQCTERLTHCFSSFSPFFFLIIIISFLLFYQDFRYFCVKCLFDRCVCVYMRRIKGGKPEPRCTRVHAAAEAPTAAAFFSFFPLASNSLPLWF